MRLEWDASGHKLYETGVDHGVLYQPDKDGAYKDGVVWDGLTGITESPSGAEASPQYADNIKYLNLISAEEFGGTIEAFSYPEEFMVNDGTAEIIKGVNIGQQARKPFGLCYRTKIGNDIDGQDHGYKLHLLYGCLASPSEKAYSTVNDSPEAITFSWEFTTTPVNVKGHSPTASLTVNSTKFTPEKMKALEDILYGSETSEPRMPLPDEVATILGDVEAAG